MHLCFLLFESIFILDCARLCARACRFPYGRYVEFVSGQLQLSDAAFAEIVAGRLPSPPIPPPTTPPPPFPPSPPPPLAPPCVERPPLANATDTEVNVSSSALDDSVGLGALVASAFNSSNSSNVTEVGVRYCDDIMPPPPPSPKPPPPLPPPPTGFAALTLDERAVIQGGLLDLLTTATRLVPLDKYTPISKVEVSPVDYNFTLQYSIFGACPVIHGVISWQSVQSGIAGLGLINASVPTCTVLNLGAPAPPPSPPPPPSVPPATVRVNAVVGVSLQTSGLDLTASDVLAQEAYAWGRGRVQAGANTIIGREDSAGHALTAVTLHEGSSIFLGVGVENAVDLANLLPQMQRVAEEVMCPPDRRIKSCIVTAALPSPRERG